jgi:hypothetical protein
VPLHALVKYGRLLNCGNTVGVGISYTVAAGISFLTLFIIYYFFFFVYVPIAAD